MILPALFFYLFAGICVASAVMVIASRNPVHSVLFLILTFFSAAGLFLLLGAEFLAMLLVVVYVGAVAVLFLFVVMMLDVDFGALKQGFMADPDYGRLATIDPQRLPEDAIVLYPNANGGIVLFKRSEYIRVGGYNARLEGWGGEDDELLRRASRLGVRWHSMNVPMFHLHHDSVSRGEHIERIRDTENARAPEAIADMSQEEVEALAIELSAFFR